MPTNIVAINNLSRVRLYSGQPGTGEGVLYTAPASVTAKVSQLIIANTIGSPASLSLSAVPSGGAAGVTNRLLHGLMIEGNSIAVLDLSVYLQTGDFLSAVQGTSGALTLSIFGETYA